jgi:hypothetical protein
MMTGGNAMRNSDLIERLMALPLDSEVYIAAEWYTGGDYSQELVEPIIHTGHGLIILCDHTTEWYARQETEEQQKRP